MLLGKVTSKSTQTSSSKLCYDFTHYRGSIEMQDHHTITVGYVTVLIASGNKAVYDLLHYWLDVDYVHHQT